MAVEVRISNARLAAFNNEIHSGMHTLAKLRAAGVPVLGDLGVAGVSTGVLSVSADVDDLVGTDETVWRWVP